MGKKKKKFQREMIPISKNSFFIATISLIFILFFLGVIAIIIDAISKV